MKSIRYGNGFMKLTRSADARGERDHCEGHVQLLQPEAVHRQKPGVQGFE